MSKFNHLFMLAIFLTIESTIRGCVIDNSGVADCSHSLINWTIINNIPNDYIYPAKSLILSHNDFYNNYSFGYRPIIDYGLKRFYQLEDKLVMSHNMFDSIHELAFFTSKSYSHITDTIYPLEFSTLDLSDNNFSIVPFNGLKYLPSLRVLILSGNPIKKFDMGDFNHDSHELLTKWKQKNINKKFHNLQEIYLNSTDLEIVDANVLNLFQHTLQVLDLSRNKIKHLSVDIYNILIHSKTFRNLDVSHNQLDCNCELLWLKYLFKHFDMRNNQAQCYINKNFLKNSLTGSSSIKIEEMSRLSYIFNNDKRYRIFRDDSNISNDIDDSLNDDQNESSYLANISELDDKMFVCEMNVTCADQIVDQNTKYQVECVTYSFPKATQKWLFYDKDIKRLASENNSQTLIFKTEINKSFMFNEKTIAYEYRHKFKTVYNIDDLEGGNYSFKVSLSFDPSARFETPSKTYSFKIHNDYYVAKYIHFRNETVLASLKTKHNNYLFWLILAACILFSVMVVIYVFVCILVRRKNNQKMSHVNFIHQTSFYDNYTSSTSAYSSLNRRNPIYMSARSNSSRGNYDNTISQPLKPDTIREHQESNSIYSNLNNSKYINLLFKTPTTPGRKLIRILDNNNNNSNIYYNNSDSSNSETNLVRYNSKRRGKYYDQVSFDRNPAETTLLQDERDGVESTSLSNSSKSFDENIEEYLDPKFDDLRKPEQKAQQEQSEQKLVTIINS